MPDKMRNTKKCPKTAGKDKAKTVEQKNTRKTTTINSTSRTSNKSYKRNLHACFHPPKMSSNDSSSISVKWCNRERRETGNKNEGSYVKAIMELTLLSVA